MHIRLGRSALAAPGALLDFVGGQFGIDLGVGQPHRPCLGFYRGDFLR